MVFSHTRFYYLISLLVLTPLGFASKFYYGPSAWWVNNYAGGILYEMFWCLLIMLCLPYANAIWVVCSVLGVTCLFEFLQLWHPLFLESIRSTFFGGTLIGDTFTWWDFPHYLIGCFASWLMIKRKYKYG